MLKGFLFTGILVTMGAAVSTFEASYTREATCVSIESDVATFEDTTGNLWDWEIEPQEEFTLGCSYKLSMDTMHTIGIEDDWIKKIEKKG